jgi:hypothetical protein
VWQADRVDELLIKKGPTKKVVPTCRYDSAPKLCMKANADRRVKRLEGGASSCLDIMISNTHMAALIQNKLPDYVYTNM